MISTLWGIIPLALFVCALVATYTSDAYDQRFCEVYFPSSPNCFTNINEQDELFRPYFTIGLILIFVFMLVAYLTNNILIDKSTLVEEKRYGIYTLHNSNDVKRNKN